MTSTRAGATPGDAAEEDPATALRLLELVGASLRRQAAGDLTHRREEGKSAAVRLDGLVRDCSHSGIDERARERLVRGDVKVGE